MQGQTNDRIRIPKLQRTPRKRMTDAENALWRVLRGRQLEGCKFRRQHPYGDYILDFVCLEKKLVIEVDGGQHLDSLRDARRDAHLSDSGFTVLRFWNHDVLTDAPAVADQIARTLIRLNPTHPHPGPPLEGEGDDTGDLHPRVRSDGAHSKSGT
ncbi:MAG: endonuclease domain-containing protein [Lysobacteraceae bacterium]